MRCRPCAGPAKATWSHRVGAKRVIVPIVVGGVLNYLVKLRPREDRDALEQIMSSQLLPEVIDYPTVADSYRDEGRVEGRAEGRVEGRAEGRVEGRAEGRVEGRAEGLQLGLAQGKTAGQREALLRLIESRFGLLSPELRARVEQAERRQLEAWLDRLFAADSAEALLAL